MATVNQTILVVFPAGEDIAVLQEILAGPQWMLRVAATVAEARQALLAFSIDVVISEGRLADGHCWEHLLDLLQPMRNPPPLIVADRLADERLWAEVLNLGGHDLLAKPFVAKEVLYAVGMACRCRENRERMMALRKPARPAEPNAAYTAKVRAAHGRAD